MSKTPEEIMIESAEQEAVKARWDGWTWKRYQAAIVRLNHRVSALEQIATIAQNCAKGPAPLIARQTFGAPLAQILKLATNET